MIRYWTICGVLIALVTIILGCGEDNPVKPEDSFPKIIEVQVPEKIWTGSETAFIVTVAVSDAQGLADIESVFLTVLGPDSLTIALATVLNDSAQHGDLIAFDGLYSRVIDISFTQGEPGDYYFIFQATDSEGHTSQIVTETVQALSGAMNEPPTIVEIILPEIVSVDASIEYSFNVRASDPQGIADLDFVIFRIHKLENPAVTYKDTVCDDGTDPDVAPQDGMFTGIFTPVFADSVVGSYPFSFQAFDKSGDSTDLVRRDVKVINEANAPPLVFNLTVPDTFDSQSETNHFLITLEVIDPQGLNDVSSVHFTSLKPDSTWANNGDPIPLFDNGTFGDVVPGDGIYSFEVIFDPTAQKGNYTWTFSAVDRSGARSNTIVHILTII